MTPLIQTPTDVWPDGVPKLEPIPAPELPERVFVADTWTELRRDLIHAGLTVLVCVLVGGPAAYGLRATGIADAKTAIACGLAFMVVAFSLAALVLCRRPTRHGAVFVIDKAAR